jgi:hypothetical protein
MHHGKHIQISFYAHFFFFTNKFRILEYGNIWMYIYHFAAFLCTYLLVRQIDQILYCTEIVIFFFTNILFDILHENNCFIKGLFCFRNAIIVISQKLFIFGVLLLLKYTKDTYSLAINISYHLHHLLSTQIEHNIMNYSFVWKT